jgi:hypothetical protein
MRVAGNLFKTLTSISILIVLIAWICNGSEGQKVCYCLTCNISSLVSVNGVDNDGREEFETYSCSLIVTRRSCEHNTVLTITIMGTIHRPVFYLKFNGTIHRPVFYLKFNSTLYVCPHLTGNTWRLRYESNRLMLSIALWWWYINVTITILDNIHHPVFYLKHNVSAWILSPFSDGTSSFWPNK